MDHRPFKDQSTEWLQGALDRAIELKSSTWSLEIRRGERLFKFAMDELFHRAMEQIEKGKV